MKTKGQGVNESSVLIRHHSQNSTYLSYTGSDLCLKKFHFPLHLGFALDTTQSKGLFIISTALFLNLSYSRLKQLSLEN